MLQLETVPEAAVVPNPSGRNQHAHEDTGNDCPKPDSGVVSFPERTAKQLRAINRAPDVVKDAYREGRISQTLGGQSSGPRIGVSPGFALK